MDDGERQMLEQFTSYCFNGGRKILDSTFCGGSRVSRAMEEHGGHDPARVTRTAGRQRRRRPKETSRLTRPTDVTAGEKSSDCVTPGDRRAGREGGTDRAPVPLHA